MSSSEASTPEIRLETALDALYSVSRVMSRSLAFDQTVATVLRVLAEHYGMSRALVYLPATPGLPHGFHVVHGMDACSPLPDADGYAKHSMVGRVLQGNRSIVIERLMDDPHYVHQSEIFLSDAAFIGVPIQCDHRSVGLLALQPQHSNPMHLADYARIGTIVANLIAQKVSGITSTGTPQRAMVEKTERSYRSNSDESAPPFIVGHTPKMQRVFQQIRQVAKWKTTVLVRGETGTGKELIAESIHYQSPRAAGPFIKLNCAALPKNLLESDLFGHEKGAFTGALAQRKGRFEMADGGTLFLDEIGEISPAFQAKLLRVLQEGEFERVGGTRTLKVDVRVIAATNVDLELEVESGRFREDLYYRLNVMSIQLPPLRERSEDIPEIARYLLNKIAAVQGRPLQITDSALRILLHQEWPGNVRELENCIERAAVMSEDGRIDRDLMVLGGIEERVTPQRSSHNSVDLDDPELDERERVIAALEQAGWVQAKAARLLNMTPRQIAYRVQTLNIKMRQI